MSKKAREPIPKTELERFCEETWCTPQEAQKYFYGPEDGNRYYYYRDESNYILLSYREALAEFTDKNTKLIARRHTAMEDLEKVFDKYRGDYPAIESDDLYEFLTTMKFQGLDDEDKCDFYISLIFWKLKCSEFGLIKKEDFTKGFCRNECYNESDIRSFISKLVSNFKTDLRSNPKIMGELHRYIYHALQRGRNVPLDLENTINAMWIMLPQYEKFTSYEKLIHWLEEVKKPETVSRDFWDNLYAFAQTIGDNYNKYSFDDAWNTTLDEYVAYVLKEQSEDKTNSTQSGSQGVMNDDEDEEDEEND